MGAEGVGCACQHAKGEGDPAVAIERSDVRVLRALVTEEPIAEPLFAIAEGSGGPARVFSCGPGGCTPDPQVRGPEVISVARYRAQTDGTLLLVGEDTVPLEKSVARAMATPLGKRDNACVPWLRTVRDPKRFGACMKVAQELGPIDDAAKVFRIFQHELGELEDQEVFAVLMLDTQLYARGRSVIHRGTRDRAEVSIPDTLRLPVYEGATSIIIVHNHPSGRVQPSDSDKALTKSLKHACDVVRIPLMDHVIIGRDKYYSFADHGLL